MRRIAISIFMISLILLLINQVSYAVEYKMPPAEWREMTDYNPFGPDYTPMGSSMKGSESGEIPDWEGSKNYNCPEGYSPGDFLPNIFKDDKVLFRIDHTNIDKYKERLTVGQIRRLERNKFFYMDIYPSHRSYQFPDLFTRATYQNTKTAHLDENNILCGFNGGLPFPFPKNGAEIIWNVKKPWSGSDLYNTNCRRVVSSTGKIRKTQYAAKVLAFDETRLYSCIDNFKNPEGVGLKLLSFYTYPADRYGEANLVITFIDDDKGEDIWSYIPSLRRVRRAPSLNEGTQGDGESVADESGGFGYRGKINNFSWKLLDKKEFYVAEDNYDMWKLNASDEEECLTGDINPAILRYELHRCYVVEGIAVEGLNHPYSRRVYYIDEDYMMPHASENYDRRGNLWRMGEYYQQNDYCLKHRIITGNLYLNLESGRYELSGGCRTVETKTNAGDICMSPDEFTVQALRQLGR